MSKKRNILHITTVSSIGGAEKLILELARLQKNFFKWSSVYVVIVGPKGLLNDELSQNNIENESFDIESLFGVPKAILKLLYYIHIKKIKLLHSHLFLGGVFGGIAKLLFPGTKLIHTRHYSDVYTNYRKNDFRRFIDKYFVNKISNHLVAISEDVKRTLLIEKASEKKIKIIYNGVIKQETSLLEYEEENLKTSLNNEILSFKNAHPTGLVFYNIGAFREEKGHLNILKLLKELSYTDLKFLCIFIGDGAYRPQIDRYCQDNNLTEHIRFLGFQKHPYAFIKHCDIFLHLPELEGFGLVVCEAMREEKIVMASNLGGIVEIIKDGENGFLVDPKSVTDQVLLIKKIISLSDTERRIILNKARKSFLKNYTLQQCGDKYNFLYKECMGDLLK